MIGVRDVRKRHVNLVGACPLNLRLGNAERVNSLAHDVDRLIDRLTSDLGLFGRLRLVDQRDAALEVQPKHGGLGCDHEPGENEQPGHEQENE